MDDLFLLRLLFNYLMAIVIVEVRSRVAKGR
jgi:hypothetical protein